MIACIAKLSVPFHDSFKCSLLSLSSEQQDATTGVRHHRPVFSVLTLPRDLPERAKSLTESCRSRLVSIVLYQRFVRYEKSAGWQLADLSHGEKAVGERNFSNGRLHEIFPIYPEFIRPGWSS